jgi:excisionase family DNA binding protein
MDTPGRFRALRDDCETLLPKGRRQPFEVFVSDADADPDRFKGGPLDHVENHLQRERLKTLIVQTVICAGFQVPKDSTPLAVGVRRLAEFGVRTHSQLIADYQQDDEGVPQDRDQSITNIAALLLTFLASLEREAPDADPANQKRRTDRGVVTVQQAAKFLHLHEDTIRRMQDKGTIELVKIESRRRVLRSDIDRLLNSGDYPKRRD